MFLQFRGIVQLRSVVFLFLLRNRISVHIYVEGRPFLALTLALSSYYSRELYLDLRCWHRHDRLRSFLSHSRICFEYILGEHSYQEKDIFSKLLILRSHFIFLLA